MSKDLKDMTNEELIIAYKDHESFMSYGHYGNSDFKYGYNILREMNDRNLEIEEEN